MRGDEAVSEDELDEGNGHLTAQAGLNRLSWALRSDPGHVRLSNEDFAGVFTPGLPEEQWDRGAVFIVADGLGGHAAGEVASRVAVETALARWQSGPATPAHSVLRDAIRAANVGVFDASMEHHQRGMGTTLTALTLAGHEAIIGQVGDSRCYLVRGEQVVQLTQDHSRVAEMLRMKLISAEQAVNHPARAMLTRTLGADPAVQVDIIRHAVADGDVFVLCSDGLWDLVPRSDIGQVCRSIGTQAVPSPMDAADQLVEEALKRGAPDNVTTLVVRVTSGLPFPPGPSRRSFFRRG